MCHAYNGKDQTDSFLKNEIQSYFTPFNENQRQTKKVHLNQEILKNVPICTHSKKNKDEPDDCCDICFNYIQDGEVPSDKICSACDNESLVYQDGCETCVSCGYAKCG